MSDKVEKKDEVLVSYYNGTTFTPPISIEDARAVVEGRAKRIDKKPSVSDKMVIDNGSGMREEDINSNAGDVPSGCQEYYNMGSYCLCCTYETYGKHCKSEPCREIL